MGRVQVRDCTGILQNSTIPRDGTGFGSTMAWQYHGLATYNQRGGEDTTTNVLQSLTRFVLDKLHCLSISSPNRILLILVIDYIIFIDPVEA